MNTQSFTSVDNKHTIKIVYDDEVAWFEITKIKYEYYKSFLLLLKTVISFLKFNKIKDIKQYANTDDVSYFKKSEILKLNDNENIITTKLENFAEEIYSVFGLLYTN
jgi:hypothetical protein